MRLISVLGPAALLACIIVAGAQLAVGQTRALEPASPGILAGGFLYVSGQGAQDAQGRVPREPAAQFRQCLSNLKTVVEASGLNMEHVIYVQVYLTEYTDEGPLNQAWKEFFPKSPPARSTIGVASLRGTPVEMTAIAVQDLTRKKPIVPPGYPASSPLSPAILVGDRLYLSGYLGRDISTGHVPQDSQAQVQLSLDRMRTTLKVAGADFRNVVFMTPYFTDRVPRDVLNKVCRENFDPTNLPAWGPVHVLGLPTGANVEFTGMAIMGLSERRSVRPRHLESNSPSAPCVFASDTLYCSAMAGLGTHGGNPALSLEAQTWQTMRSLLDALRQTNMTFANVVATHVYLDDIQDADRFDRVYAEYFTAKVPTRTVIQPATPGKRVPDVTGQETALEEISIIAVK